MEPRLCGLQSEAAPSAPKPCPPEAKNAEVRFKGGALHTLEVPVPLPFCILSRTKPEVIEEIDRLLDEHTYQEIVESLNARGFRSGDGRMFNLSIVARLCKQSGLKSRRQRLREAGLLSPSARALK